MEKNDVNKESAALNFQSILIITYGRSGSTLLQGVLNSIDGVVIRGENYNMCYHLFEGYRSILKSKEQPHKNAQSSFYGSDLMDVSYYLKQMEETVKNLLLSDKKTEDSVRSYGFKEIRYGNHLNVLPEFLDFLQKIFPNCCFVFNTRNKEDVIKSWIHLKWKKETETKQVLKTFQNIENVFLDYAESHSDRSFHITYEDVVGKKERLKELFSFLGAMYDEKKINSVLKLRHSHRPNQKHIKKLTSGQTKKSSIMSKFFKNRIND